MPATSAMIPLFLLLAALAPGDPDGAQDSFDSGAVLKSHNIKMNVESLMAVLAGPDEKKVKALIEKLGAEEFGEREKATAALKAMGPDVLSLIKKYGVSATDIEIRLRSKTLVKEISEKAFINFRLRQAAVRALGQLKAKKAVAAIGGYLGSDSPEVRRAAAIALVKIGGEESHKALREFLRGAASNATPLEKVCEVLGAFAGIAKEKDYAVIAELAGKGARPVAVSGRCTRFRKY